ncbi:hypothetical protein EYM_07345 [Ignicoccus islandicus DSM 13165]|uniref:SAM-dependent methyltransferase TRM5/TYW2-type domain-containing protein n=1 Tax=Ignicoccus islandicus DSM 13165 TaxID=940295 RepID=A0A0U2U9T6_9CREN|nr:class I SAM-dependent methyltransferase family protein [Ignicoccus islandicus]ALU12772.1 hypothetical protein EYM_07345 [Ignicoccus islandicus DSM 13165]
MKVSKSLANEVLKNLRKIGIVDNSLKPKVEGDYVLIPIKKSIDAYELVYEDFEPRKRNLSLKECISRKLGEGNWPRSFNQIGDIAVISLKDNINDQLKEVIVECLMSNSKVKAVWGKVETSGEERVAKLVHLGGERITETIYKENGLSFKVDISKVYVNPSLATEHYLVSELVRDGERVLDLFAGIGFFSFNIAKRKECKCLAVDMNPYAIKYAIESLFMNKLKGNVSFLLSKAEDLLEVTARKQFDVTIMNLPHKSHEYVDRVVEVTRRLVIAYSVGSREEVIGRFRRHEIINLRKVLDYAPYKYIWRVELKP